MPWKGVGCPDAVAQPAVRFPGRPATRARRKCLPPSRDAAIQIPKRASAPATYSTPLGATVVVASRGKESRRSIGLGLDHVRPPSAVELTTTPSYLQRSN